MKTREFTEEEKSLIKECFLCSHAFGDVYLPAIEFITTIKTFYVPVDFIVVKTMCERTSAPYECYNVSRKKVDVDTLKVKLVKLEDNTIIRITLK